MVFDIDEINMTAQMDKIIPVPLSITRSNVEFDKQNNCIYAMCANIKDNEIKSRAKILGYNYSTGKCITNISFNNDFFTAKFIDFNLKSIKSTLEEEDKPYCIGRLHSPVAVKNLPDGFNEDNLMSAVFLKRNLYFHFVEIYYRYIVKTILSKKYFYIMMTIFLYNILMIQNSLLKFLKTSIIPF